MPTAHKVRCAKCKTPLGTERVVRDAGIFRQVKTDWIKPHFHYQAGLLDVELRCLQCSDPGYSPEFAAKLRAMGAAEWKAIEVRRASRVARGLPVGKHDPREVYERDIAQVHQAWLEADPFYQASDA